MKKWYLAAAGAAALLVAAACSDKSVTETGRGIRPGASSHTAVSGAVFTSTNPLVDDQDPSDNHTLCFNQPDTDPANDCNIYKSKSFVWLSGGPGPSDLADGTYMFAVLVPGGQGGNAAPNDCTIADLSDTDPCNTSHTDAGDTWQHRVFSISNHVITYPASGYLGGHDFQNNMIRLMGYDNTTNPGGEYVMAVCNLADATGLLSATGPGVNPSDCKYDNFKVRPGIVCAVPPCDGNPFATVAADKFYDANANGVLDAGDTPIAGWPMTLNELLPSASATQGTPASWPLLDPGTYSITEGVPTGSGQAANWFITYKGTTGATGTNGLAGSIRLSLATATDLTIGGVQVLAGGAESRIFGNVCVGGGYGKTRGFWSNNNGGSVLRNVSGSLVFTEFKLPNNTGGTPTGATWTLLANLYTTTKFGSGGIPTSTNVSNFQSWIGSANAGSNLSYQLGAQVAAMYLNINVGSPASGGWVSGVVLNKVDPNAIIYAPGTLGANALGFSTVGAVMGEAKDFLKNYFNVPTGSLNSANRTYGSALIAALDGGNSNTSFVQSTPCAATFLPVQ